MHAKVFSIQIFQYFRQILPRVCTLVFFIFLMYSVILTSVVYTAYMEISAVKKFGDFIPNWAFKNIGRFLFLAANPRIHYFV